MIANAHPSDFVSIGKASKEFGVSQPTLRNLLDTNPNLCYRSVGGHRRVSRSRLQQHLGLVDTDDTTTRPKRVMVAIRVSTQAQKTSLEYQREKCLAWCKENMPEHEVIVNERICSGLFLSHEKFIDIVLAITNQEVTDIVCLHSDRLARGAMDMLKKLMEQFGVTLHVIEAKPNKSYGETLSEDILAFIGSHHARYQGQKAKLKLEITVEQEDLVRIYQQYKQGMSYADLSNYCNSNAIHGTQDGKEVTLTAAKLHQLLSRNQKVLEELVGEVTNETTVFIQMHLKPLKAYKSTRRNQDDLLRQMDIYERYARWCGENDVVAVSPKKLGLTLKTLGYQSTRAKQGCKCFFARWI